MSFKFKKASCVVVGAFNVYVFHPCFFAQTKIVSEGEEALIETDFSQPGFRLSFPNTTIKWGIRPDRILVETTEFSADCGALVAKVLETLPWTPITALGANFEFEASCDEFEAMPCRRFLPALLSEKTSRRTIHAAVEEQPHVFNFSISRMPEHVGFGINVHTEVKKIGLGKLSRTDISAMMEGYARQFHEFRDHAITLAREVLEVEVEDAKNIDNV